MEEENFGHGFARMTRIRNWLRLDPCHLCKSAANPSSILPGRFGVLAFISLLQHSASYIPSALRENDSRRATFFPKTLMATQKPDRRERFLILARCAPRYRIGL
jgi:hypothetical protein